MTELLVAMAIGAIVLLGLTDVLLDSRISYVREEQFARMQETGRFGMLTLAASLRSSRSLDCESTAMHAFRGSLSVKACDLLDLAPGAACSSASASALTTDHILTPERALGYDNNATNDPGWLADLPAAARANVNDRRLRGDVFVSWGADGAGALMLNAMDATDMTTAIAVQGPPASWSGVHFALVSDCAGADIFRTTNPSGGSPVPLAHAITHDSQTVNASDRLSRAYNWQAPAGAQRQVAQPTFKAKVYPFDYEVYYICCVDADGGGIQAGAGNVARCNNDPVGFRPALCVWSLDEGGSNPVAADVADMRVTYTGDSDGDWQADFFAEDLLPVRTAFWVTGADAWSSVSGASIELLVASAADGIRTATQAISPSSPAWPPNQPNAAAVHADTLGAGLPADRRLYERFVINVALRARSPWYVSP